MQHLFDEMELLRAICLGTNTRCASRTVSNYANALLRPLDLNVAQMTLLAVIAMRPEKTIAAMSENLMLSESTLTRNLTVLERRGLVRSEGGRGRRGKQVELTEEGVDLLERGVEVWRQFNDTLAAEIEPVLLENGRRFLTAVTDAAERLGAQAGASRGGDDD
ncbi:MAG: MarR family winged helix-turn-helix transcriptional regulator [Hyphomonadaceae bacterium]